MRKTSNLNTNENTNVVSDPTKKRLGNHGSKAKVTVKVKKEDSIGEVDVVDNDTNDSIDIAKKFVQREYDKSLGNIQPALYGQTVDIGPNSDYTAPIGSTLHNVCIKPKSSYFKAIFDKASDIIKALVSNDMYVGSIKIESMILAVTGQFILFSNEDTGVGNDIIKLNCYYPYIDGNELYLLKAGSTDMESPDSIKRKLCNAAEMKASLSSAMYNRYRSAPDTMDVMNSGHRPAPGMTNYSVPIPRNYSPNITKARLSVYDYANGLCQPLMYREYDKTYYPVCIWDLDYFKWLYEYNKLPLEASNNKLGIYPKWVMPEKAALKMLKGKAFPLIFAGSVPEETILMTEDAAPQDTIPMPAI